MGGIAVWASTLLVDEEVEERVEVGSEGLSAKEKPEKRADRIKRRLLQNVRTILTFWDGESPSGVGGPDADQS